MEISKEDIQVVQNPDKNRFEVKIESYLALCEYILGKTRIIFTHTEVPKALAGNSIGAKMAKAGLDYAREHNLQIMPLCPFVAAYMERHPEYYDLLMPGLKLKTKL